MQASTNAQGEIMKNLFLSIAIAGLGWTPAAWPETTDEGSIQTGTAPTVPIITSIRLEGTVVVVLARVPPGINKVTLESCRRLAGEAWTPKAVSRLNGTGGEISFRLVRSPDLELLRVRGDAREALPGFFYQGPSSFAGQPVGGAGLMGGAADATATGAGGGVVTFNNGAAPTSPGGSAPARTVSESDIWEIK